ncbi:MAG: DUF1805 domain-containing protein [Thermoplasmata archaeon]|jgi:uncharacterized protein YunC (DUF1805 family)
MIIEQINLKGETALGIKVEMNNAPLILIKVRKGFIMCGYLNIEAASSLGDIAGRIRGVKDFKDLLDGKVVEVTEGARKLGLMPGITGREFLERLGDINEQ